MELLVAILIAAVIGMIVKLVVSFIAPRYQDIAGLVVFLIVLLERLV